MSAGRVGGADGGSGTTPAIPRASSATDPSVVSRRPQGSASRNVAMRSGGVPAGPIPPANSDDEAFPRTERGTRPVAVPPPSRSRTRARTRDGDGVSFRPPSLNGRGRLPHESSGPAGSRHRRSSLKASETRSGRRRRSGRSAPRLRLLLRAGRASVPRGSVAGARASAGHAARGGRTAGARPGRSGSSRAARRRRRADRPSVRGRGPARARARLTPRVAQRRAALRSCPETRRRQGSHRRKAAFNRAFPALERLRPACLELPCRGARRCGRSPGVEKGAGTVGHGTARIIRAGAAENPASGESLDHDGGLAAEGCTAWSCIRMSAWRCCGMA